MAGSGVLLMRGTTGGRVRLAMPVQQLARRRNYGGPAAAPTTTTRTASRPDRRLLLRGSCTTLWCPTPPSDRRSRQRRFFSSNSSSSVAKEVAGGGEGGGSVVEDRIRRSGSSHSHTSSASPRQVDKFSAMDDSWWDPIHNPLIGMNAVRVEYIKSQIDESLATSHENANSENAVTRRRILDMGCGGGLLCESLKRIAFRWDESETSSCEVVGIDPSSRLVDVARRHAALDPRTSCIEYRCNTVEQYAEEVLPNPDEVDGLFDVVCLLEVVEHVENPAHLDSMMSAISQLLKPNGLLFVSTMNRTWKSHVLTIVGAEYVMRYLPIGTHQWHLYKAPQTIEQWVGRHGLQVVNVCGIVPTSVPVPYVPSLLLSPSWKWRLDPNDTDVNWIGTYRKA